eukprot:COSAG06_NODE_5022_length_3783_cov_3.150109_2_plen_967_part_01
MDATNNVYSLLQSDDGDDGVSVNKANFEPYNQGVIMNMALKVEQSGDDYMVTFLSSRHSSDGSVEGAQRVTGITGSYSAGKVGIFVYAHTAKFDNFQLTQLSAETNYCEGAGSCNMETGTCDCDLAGAAETMPDCSRGVKADGSVVRAPRFSDTQGGGGGSAPAGAANCIPETCHNDGHWVEVAYPEESECAGGSMSIDCCTDQCLLHPEATALQYNDGGWCGCMTMGDDVSFDDAIAGGDHLGPWTACTICDLSALCFYEVCHNDGHWVEVEYPEMGGLTGTDGLASCRDQCVAHPEATAFQFNDGGWCGCMVLADDVTFADAIEGGEHLGPWTACTICDISNSAGAPTLVPEGAAIIFGQVSYESRFSTYRIPADGSASFEAAMAAWAAAPEGGDYCNLDDQALNDGGNVFTGPMLLDAATGMSNQDACGGPNTNIAFHYIIPMTVFANGIWQFQFHTDWGNNGGYTCFDGVCQHHSGDVWGNIMFEAPLTPGDHMLEMVGFEGCCDGWQTLNVALPSACVAAPGVDCGTIVPDWLLVDSTGDTDYTCSPADTADAPADQLVMFGCIEHETVQCTYSANANPNDFEGALAAFAECRIASVGVDGFCTISTNEARGLSNQDACGGPNTNIAFHTLIPFSASCEGVYHFRFHADYGLGGYTGIDGVEHAAGDIWGHVHIADVDVSLGDHYFEGLGFEGCCDGHSELEIHLPPDGEGDPWRLVVAGPTDTLSGECGATPPPFTPPTGTSSQTCIYSIYGTTSSYPQLSMPAAEDACVQIGGHLASAHSQEDGDLINELVPDGGRAWLGYHDMGFEAGCTDDRHQGIGGNIEAATFVWTDATPSDYENWAGGEPNDWQDGVARCDGSGNEDCTEAWRGGENWNDANCDGTKPYICAVCPNHQCYPTRFEYNADSLNKMEAEFQCVIGGGHLASIHSDAAQAMLDDLIPDGGRAWIGYHDRFQEAGCTDD